MLIIKDLKNTSKFAIPHAFTSSKEYLLKFQSYIIKIVQNTCTHIISHAISV